MASAATLSSPNDKANTVLYCRTCGDSVSLGQRCKHCGSRGQPPVLNNMNSLARARKDPWKSRYTAAIAGDEDLDDQDHLGENNDPLAGMGTLRDQQRLQVSSNSFNRTSTTAFSMGIGMPSSISRDLRPSPTPSPNASCADRAPQQRSSVLPARSPASAPAETAPASDDSDSLGPLPPLSPGRSHMAHSPSQPLMEHPATGGLSKLCGSIIEPESSRAKKACAGCGLIFVRDTTIYAPPASAVAQAQADRLANGGIAPPGSLKDDDFYCRECYIPRFALGTCASPSCGKPVLGTTKEYGAYVKAGPGTIYHGTCFRCYGCDRGGGKPPHGDGTQIVLDLEGRPSCEDCFGATPRRREVTPGPSLPTEKPRAASKTDGAVPWATAATTRNSQPPHPSTATAFSPTLGSYFPSSRDGSGEFRQFGIGAGAGAPMGSARPGHFKRGSYSATGNPNGDRKMTATIAELSQRFGSLATHPGAQPLARSGSNGEAAGSSQQPLSRSGSISRPSSRNSVRAPRPRAAHFSRPPSPDKAAAYDLGAFRSSASTSSGPSRSDSRCRMTPTEHEAAPSSRAGSPTRVEPLTQTSTGGQLGEARSKVAGNEGPRTRTLSGFPLPRNRREAEEAAESAAKSHIPRSSTTTVPVGPEVRVKTEPSPRPSSSLSLGEDAGDLSGSSDGNVRCLACGKGPFDGPNQAAGDAVLVTIPGKALDQEAAAARPVHLHAACFRCAVCDGAINSKAFVRLDAEPASPRESTGSPSREGSAPPASGSGSDSGSLPRFAHPACAPPVALTPRTRENSPSPTHNAPSGWRQSHGGAGGGHAHPTMRSLPRPSAGGAREYVAVHSFIRPRASQVDAGANSSSPASHPKDSVSSPLSRGASAPASEPPSKSAGTPRTSANVSSGASLRQFKASCGAAPPTRSTLNVHRPGSLGGPGGSNPAAGMFTSISPSPREASRLAEAQNAAEPAAASASASTRAASSSVVTPSSAGARPPLPAQPHSFSHPHAGAPSFPARPAAAPRGFSQYGGMQTCSGCTGRLTSLESVPGPAGTVWHKKCLVCRAVVSPGAGQGGGGGGRWGREKEKVCGKQLDSYAKVRPQDGDVRCASCFREGR